MSDSSSPNRFQACWEQAVLLLEAASRQHHVVALRDGMIASVPIILVGSTFLLLGAQGPVLKSYFNGEVAWLPNLLQTAFGRWYLDHTAQILFPYRLTMGLLALYIASPSPAPWRPSIAWPPSHRVWGRLQPCWSPAPRS